MYKELFLLLLLLLNALTEAKCEFWKFWIAIVVPFLHYCYRRAWRGGFMYHKEWKRTELTLCTPWEFEHLYCVMRGPYMNSALYLDIVRACRKSWWLVACGLWGGVETGVQPNNMSGWAGAHPTTPSKAGEQAGGGDRTTLSPGHQAQSWRWGRSGQQHLSGLGQVVVTTVRHSPAIARQVHSKETHPRSSQEVTWWPFQGFYKNLYVCTSECRHEGSYCSLLAIQQLRVGSLNSGASIPLHGIFCAFFE